MNLKKNLSYIKTHIEISGKLYLHKISFNTKWDDFINKEYKKVLVKDPEMEEKEPYWKYYNKRRRQYSEKAKLLLNNDRFIKRVTETVKTFGLDTLAFGWQSKPNAKPEHKYYDPEYHQQLTTLWKCLLRLKDYQFLKKFGQRVLKDLNSGDRGGYNKIPSSIFTTSVESILNDFGLSKFWGNSIVLLLLTGFLFPPQNYLPIHLEKKNGKVSLVLPIYPETQIDDIKFNWDKITSIKKSVFDKPERTKPSKTADYYIQMAKSKKETGERDWDLLNLEKLKIPENAAAETRAYERFRKGRNRAAKKIDSLIEKKLKEPAQTKMLEEVAGVDDGVFDF
jgi:hypothetical protein